jgi:peroxiredoxin (alkyl hydroperoxide reductase subunit C)
VLGVLPDNLPSLKTWSRGLGISFPILSDFWPHGEAGSAYGVLRKEGILERAVFIIDRKGVIRYIDIHDINEDPPVNPILRVLATLEKETR